MSVPLSLLSFSAWTFGRQGGGRCRPALYIRCQASDRDSGLWVNNLTASTEDILSVKWSLHYSRWKETGEAEKHGVPLFHIRYTPSMLRIAFVWDWRTEERNASSWSFLPQLFWAKVDLTVLWPLIKTKSDLNWLIIRFTQMLKNLPLIIPIQIA